MPRHPPCALSNLTLRQAHSAIRSPAPVLRPHGRGSRCGITRRFARLRSQKLFSLLYLLVVFGWKRWRTACAVRSPTSKRRCGSRSDAPASATARDGGFDVCAPGTDGGAGGTRTPDLRLAKAALSRLSYGPRVIQPTGSTSGAVAWWAILDSNQGPQSYQDCALTT
jgi:hypothetical protein